MVFCIIGIFLYFFNSQWVHIDKNTSLWESQTPTASEKISRPELPMSPERLRQIEQFQLIRESHTQNYETALESAFLLSGTQLNEDIQNIVENILGRNVTVEELRQALKDELNITILTADANRLLEAYHTKIEESSVYISRLDFIQEASKDDIKSQHKELILLITSMKLEESTLSPASTMRITDALEQRLNLYENFDNLENQDRYLWISQQLEFLIARHSPLRWDELRLTVESILNHLESIGIIQSAQNWTLLDETSFLPWFLYSQVHATDTSANPTYEELLLDSIEYLSSLWNDWLTNTQKLILHLQIDILTDMTLQKSIEAELSYLRWDISYIEFESRTFEYYTLLEQILLLKSTIDTPDWAISLWDIQAFWLGYYEDDSEEIEGLAPLAYLQSIDGYAVVWNLKWSYRLGEFNMILYPWYSIETLGDSETTIIFADDSILRLEPYTRVVLSGDATNITTTVDRWSMWVRVIRPLLTGERFVIEWNWVSLWVRGTSLYFSEAEARVDVVHSYDTSAWVEIIGTSQILQAWTTLNLVNNTSSTTERPTLLAQNPQLWSYIRDDLRQLSLILDDKQRWFHNNPLAIIVWDDTYLARLEAEIENTLPQSQAENSYIFETSTLRNTAFSDMTPENIHLRIVQDSMISELNTSNNTASEKITKRNAIMGLTEIELKNVENKRELESRMELWITKDIIQNIITSVDDVKNIIEDFPLLERKEYLNMIQSARNELIKNDFNGHLDNGNIYNNFPLPSTYDILYNGQNYTIVIHDWYSDNEMLSITDYEAEIWKYNWVAILWATFELHGVKRDIRFKLYIPERNLGAYDEITVIGKDIIEKFENSPRNFIDTIILPSIEIDMWEIGIEPVVIAEEFTMSKSALSSSIKKWVISPIITFSGTFVNDDGTIDRPWFNSFTHYSGDWNYYHKIFDLKITFTHPLEPSASYTSDPLWAYIKNKPCLAPHILIWTWENAGCYSLVAKADYDEDLYLRDKDNQIITTIPPQAWTGLNSWTWALTSHINTQYSNLSPSIVDRTQSRIKLEWETWVFIRPTGTDSFLTYDIWDLFDEGDDWAIEMSVRGEDLKRDDWKTYYLFASDNLAVLTHNKKIYFSYGPGQWSSWKSITINQWYNKILFNSKNKKLYINWNEIDISTNNLDTNIFIGSNKNQELQWNWIINSINVYQEK